MATGIRPTGFVRDDRRQNQGGIRRRRVVHDNAKLRHATSEKILCVCVCVCVRVCVCVLDGDYVDAW